MMEARALTFAIERDEAMNAGCDAFVGKPYMPAELTATLGRLMFGQDEIGQQDTPAPR
jgi:CheY-like chemotaxis protein